MAFRPLRPDRRARICPADGVRDGTTAYMHYSSRKIRPGKIRAARHNFFLTGGPETTIINSKTGQGRLNAAPLPCFFSFLVPGW